MARPTEPPAQPAGSGTIPIALWNIRSGGDGGLEAACRSLDSLGVNIAVLQKTRLPAGRYTRFSNGYAIVATPAPSHHQGGVALVWRDGEAYEVEEHKVYGPNVLAFELVTGVDRYYCVGAYIPPSDLTALDDVKRAWSTCPKGGQTSSPRRSEHQLEIPTG